MDDAEARRLVDAYSDLMLRLSYVYLHSSQDAEDICQTVLIRRLTKAPQFQSPEHERAWIIRTTSNACKDLLRSAARRRVIALDDAPEAAAPYDPNTSVTDAVNRLPRNQREAIYLHYYERMSIREISHATGASEAAITKRLSRARAALKRTLGDAS